jgi:hypothetical protein
MRRRCDVVQSLLSEMVFDEALQVFALIPMRARRETSVL